MLSPAGEIIYKAFAPTLKIALTIACGYIITKLGMFSPAAGKGVSVVTMSVGLPALIFSSQVKAFTLENIKAFGPLVLCAVLYQILGAFLAWVITEIFYVPMDFRWGILVMGAISNWSNLPTAIVQTMATSSPFDPDTDVELGVAYISIFVLVMNTVFFACGAHKLCALDFRENRSITTPIGFKGRWRSRMATIKRWTNRKSKDENVDPRKGDNSSSTSSAIASSTTPSYPRPTTTDWKENGQPSENDERSSELYPMAKLGGAPIRKNSRSPSFTSIMETTGKISPAEAPDAIDVAQEDTKSDRNILQPMGNTSALLPVSSKHENPRPILDPPKRSKYLEIPLSVLKSVISTPASVAVIIALPCALVQPLKALFVTVDGWSQTRIPYAPDGKPPLAFVMDTTTFIGALAVPGALILLGASFARLEMPRRWRDLPISAITAMVVVKMVLIPVFGVFFVQALRDQTTLFPPADKIRIFVAILLSGSPAAANQLIVTQLYNPDGSAHTIASFLLLQYIMMFVLCTAVAAVALYIVEM